MASSEGTETPSSVQFQQQLEQVHKAAARQFSIFRAESELRRRTKRTPYTRGAVPGLREALVLSACRYAAACAWRNADVRNACAKRTWHVSVLGEGAPKTGIWAARKERCMMHQEAMASSSAPKHTSILYPNGAPRQTRRALTNLPVVRPIPADIRRIRARKFAAAARARAELAAPAVPMVARPTAPLADARGYLQHVARARLALQSGLRALRPQGMPEAGSTAGCAAAATDAAAVRARYAGRPDELYRRRMGRRFAAVRRRRMADEAERARVVRNAEREMRRRRGSDLVLSDRALDDCSLAPFVFEQPDCAFAFSSKISQAPKLRRAMLHKYSAAQPQPLAPAMDQLQRARHCAETKELFHTRVMNRFA